MCLGMKLLVLVKLLRLDEEEEFTPAPVRPHLKNRKTKPLVQFCGCSSAALLPGLGERLGLAGERGSQAERGLGWGPFF